jgi:hypothetical protein
MTADESGVGLTIEEEALRKCALVESGSYEFPERMTRTDLIVAIIILVVSLAAMWLGFLA